MRALVRWFSRMRNVVQLKSDTAPGEAGFIDEKQLLVRLPVSRRTLFNWRHSGKLPFVNLGGRRNLYHYPSVEAALLRMQRGGVQ